MIRPTRKDVCAATGFDHFTVSASVVVDGETPMSLFHRMRSHGTAEGAFLFESIEGGELMARYSFFGVGLRTVIRVENSQVTVDGEPCEGDVVDAARTVMGRFRVMADPTLPRFQGGLVGYIGYDCLAGFEAVPLAPGAAPAPDALLLLADEVFIYDHVTHRLTVAVTRPFEGDAGKAWDAAHARLTQTVAQVTQGASALAPWASQDASVEQLKVSQNRTSEDFCAAVRTAREAIAAGEIFQVVLSQRLTVEEAVDPFELYRSLRSINPSPYMFFVRFDALTLVGASPEVLVRVEDGELLLRPIAGTRRRGRTVAEDEALGAELMNDPKELAEHRMLLDLGRNDVGRVARIGSVRVLDPIHLERFAHVMHLVSEVRGELDSAYDCFDALRACFPAGTVSGAPKLRACEMIATLEPDRRGPYSGAVGYFDFAGNMDTCIAIRTAVVEPDRVHLQAGAGIVYDSVPEHEDQECRSKARSGLLAVAMTVARGSSK